MEWIGGKYDYYLEKGVMLGAEDLAYVNDKIEVDILPEEVVEFIDKSKAHLLKIQEEDFKTLMDAETNRNSALESAQIAEEKALEAQQEREKAEEFAQAAEDAKKSAEQMRQIAETRKDEIEQAKKLTEGQLEDALKQNTTLAKTRGYIQLSTRIVWFVFILCALPYGVYLIQMLHSGATNDKLLEIAKDVILISSGGFINYLLSGSGAKKVSSGEGGSKTESEY